jgi:hypothetical protein
MRIPPKPAILSVKTLSGTAGFGPKADEQRASLKVRFAHIAVIPVLVATAQLDPLLPFKIDPMNGGKREKAVFG